MARDIWMPLAAFAGVTALAEGAGAANLGTAMSFGQIAFGLALSAVVIWR